VHQNGIVHNLYIFFFNAIRLQNEEAGPCSIPSSEAILSIAQKRKKKELLKDQITQYQKLNQIIQYFVNFSN